MAFTTTTAANGVITLTGTNQIENQTLVNVGVSAPGVEVIALGADDIVDVQNFTGSVANWTIKGGISAEEAEKEKLSDNDKLLTNTFLTLSDTFVAGNAGDDEIGDIDNEDSFLRLSASTLQGGQGNDKIAADVVNSSLLNGNKGDDVVIVFGNSANASVYGGQGRDIVHVGIDIDGDDVADKDLDLTNSSVYGALGADIIRIGDVSSLQGTVINGGDGDDTISVATFNTAQNIADKKFDATGANILGEVGDDDIIGGAGNDLIDGGAGIDTLIGDEGDGQYTGGQDTLLGGEGNDFLTGGWDADELTGGAGNDKFILPDADQTFSGDLDDGKIDVITDFTSSKGADVTGGNLDDVNIKGDKIDLGGNYLFGGSSGVVGETFAQMIAAGGQEAGSVYTATYGKDSRFTAVLVFQDNGGAFDGAVQIGAVGQFSTAAKALDSLKGYDFINQVD